MKIDVGADIEATCRKCGEVWHVIIAMDGRDILKVECKQCRARHRYRPVEGEGALASRSGGTSRVRKPPARRRTAPAVVEADASRPARAFRTTETYAVGDRVVHASFGEGVVQAVTGVKKIEVLFDSGPRTLVHARAAS